jgi:CBS domain-containing protein
MNVIDTVGAVLAHKGSVVWSIAPDATVFDAIQRMAEKNIGSLLVMEGDTLLGVVSERDYTRKVALKGKSSKKTPVKEIMISPALTVTRDHTVEECMRLMTDHRVRHLPVVEGGKVMGVISIGNLVNWIISTQSTTIEQLQQYISGQYPG